MTCCPIRFRLGHWVPAIVSCELSISDRKVHLKEQLFQIPAILLIRLGQFASPPKLQVANPRWIALFGALFLLLGVNTSYRAKRQSVMRSFNRWESAL